MGVIHIDLPESVLVTTGQSREELVQDAAVLLLFQRACEEERLTAELARQLASLLKRAQG